MMIHQKYSGIGIAMALAGLLNGCAVKMEDRSAILLALPQEWANAQSSTNLVAAKWWEGFASEELNGFVNEALAKNINLQVTASRLAQAHLRQRIAGADRRPVLSASLDASKKRSNFIGLPIGGGSVLTSRSENYGFTLSSSWEADVWGRIRAGEIASEMETAAAQSDLFAARQSLVAQTVKAWLQLTEAGEQIEIARANVSVLETSVQQSNLRFNLGVGPALDLRLGETSLAISQATLEQWQSVRAQSRRQLETLLGRYPAGAVEGADQLPALPAAIPAGLPSQLLMRRPDIRSAFHRLIAADANTAVARSGLYPKISLTASAGTSSDELENLLNNHLLVWSLGSNLTQPIFNRGRLKNNVKLRQSMAQEVVLQYRKTVLDAFSEVEIALANEELMAGREERLGESADKASQALKLAEDRFERGLEPFARVLETRQRLNESRSQQAAVRRLRLENRVALHLALGAGTELGPQLIEGKE